MVSRALVAVAILMLGQPASAAMSFPQMLEAAENGDCQARLLVAYSFYFGEYRDGTPVENSVEKAYAWASLANYQGNTQAQDLLNQVIPKLPNLDAANTLAGKYFLEYGKGEICEVESE